VTSKGSKYVSYTRLEQTDQGERWVACLKGKRFQPTYKTLDDAVDALLMEETFACNRIIWSIVEDLKAGRLSSMDQVSLRLRRASDEILERAKQVESAEAADLGDGL
jgi:hypothetical protein